MSAIAPFDAATSLDSPHVVMGRLMSIERDLAFRQGAYEAAARDWYAAQREIKRAHARGILEAPDGTVPEKKAHADLEALSCDGASYEGEYEALRAVVDVLKTRASICQSVLKSQASL